MKKKAEEHYFIDDMLCREKTPAMVAFFKARVDVALEMIRNERVGPTIL
jgi:hypothetical protein